jgi:hypothetical protein
MASVCGVYQGDRKGPPSPRNRPRPYNDCGSKSTVVIVGVGTLAVALVPQMLGRELI